MSSSLRNNFFAHGAAFLLALAPVAGTAADGPTVEVYSTATGGEQTVSLWRLPVVITISLGAGYDTNADTGADDGGSFYTTGTINLNYSFGTMRTRADLSTGTGIVYYPDDSGNTYDPNLFLTLGVSHAINLRASLNAAISIAYRAEPDFSTDLTPDRRAGNYLSSSNSVALSYQWLPRFSTVTSYSLGTLLYDDAGSSALDRFDHSIGQSFRFLYLPVTTVVLQYNAGLVTYTSNERDTVTHAILAGIDHTFSPKLNGGIRGGIELRDTQNAVDAHQGLNPNFSANLNYEVTGRTSLAWNASYSTQESYLPVVVSSLSFRTGLVATYEITPRISSNLAFYYQHNDQGSIELLPGFDLSLGVEDVFDVSLGFNYTINRFLSANVSLGHTQVESDLPGRSYSRSRLSGGLSIRF